MDTFATVQHPHLAVQVVDCGGHLSRDSAAVAMPAKQPRAAGVAQLQGAAQVAACKHRWCTRRAGASWSALHGLAWSGGLPAMRLSHHRQWRPCHGRHRFEAHVKHTQLSTHRRTAP